MTTPVYKSTIGAMVRQAEALSAIMAKGREYFAENGIDADAFIDERLCEDMLPFSFQIRSVHHHGNFAETAKSGHSGPPPAVDVKTYADLEAMVADIVSKLKAVTPEELDSLLDKDVVFSMGDINLPFTGIGYLSSFALPNFYFHAMTAYNLLRQKGVPLGKRDYLGAMELNMG